MPENYFLYLFDLLIIYDEYLTGWGHMNIKTLVNICKYFGNIVTTTNWHTYWTNSTLSSNTIKTLS